MRATIALMVLGVFTAMGSFAGVFDDAVMWCRGVRDANANGFPDQGDFPDALRLGDSTSRSHKGAASSLTTDNPDYKLKIRSEEVIEPYTGRSLGLRECLYFTSLVVEEDGSNYIYQQSFTMNNAMPSGYKFNQTKTFFKQS